MSWCERLALLDDRVADVGPVEAGDVAGRVAEAQAGADVVAGLRVGGGGAGDDGHAGEQPAQPAQLHVLGAEVVAPLADAVRLVDGEAGRGRCRGVIVDLEQARKERLGHQRLGRDVEQVEFAAVQRARARAAPRRPRARSCRRRRDAGRPQRVDLVLHQRDERRDDDAGAGAHERRQLVAERLAAAGGHEHEGVAAGDDVVDDLLLVRPVLVEAEDVAQQDASGSRRGGRRVGDEEEGHDAECSKVDGRRRPRGRDMMPAGGRSA